MVERTGLGQYVIEVYILAKDNGVGRRKGLGVAVLGSDA